LAEARHQIRKLQQVCDSHERSPLAEDDLRIRRCGIRPLRRHRANGFIIDTQQRPFAIPVVSLAYTGELSSAEWMEGVRHTHKMLRRGRRACISS
jgi:hypothetical protein